MTSKLGWHFQTIPGWATSIANSDYVKCIDPPAANPFPNSKVIVRLFMDESREAEYIIRGAAGARDYFAHWRTRYAELAYAWGFEACNEPAVATPEQRRALAEFSAEWVKQMHAIGRRAIVLSLAVGWPDIGCAPDLAPALAEADAWSVHEYSAPHMRANETWHCLRYRRTVAELRAAGARIPPLIISECGIDGGVIGQPKRGWKTFSGDRANYLSQLAWYDGELQKDDYVLAATPFTSGPNGDWVDFDVDEELSRMMATYIESQRTPTPPPSPPEPEPQPGPDAELAGIALRITSAVHLGLADLLEHAKRPAAPTPCSWALQRPLPAGVGSVTQWFAENPANYAQYNLAGHPGLDYGAASGSPVLASHDGRCEVGYDPTGYGNYVKVHADGGLYYTLYAHLLTVLAVDNEQVVRGMQIGNVGSTGNSTGPHLHFGIKATGVRNPAYGDWLDPVLFRKMNGDA